MYVTIPDETYLTFKRTLRYQAPSQVASAINSFLRRAAQIPINENYLVLDAACLGRIQQILGPSAIDSADALVRAVRQVCSVKIQGNEFVLTHDQMKRLVGKAFSRRKAGEPDESKATPEEATEIVDRFLKAAFFEILRRSLEEL